MKSILIFALFITGSLQAQEKTAPLSSSKKLQLGISLSPDICYRTLADNDGSAASSMVIASRKKYEHSKVGYTVGISVRYGLQPGLALKTGLLLSNKGYQVKQTDLIFGQPGQDDPASVKIIYRYHYLDIPLLLNFSLGSKRLQVVAGAGFTTHFLLRASNRSVVENPGGRIEKSVQNAAGNFKKFNFSPTISMGASYRLSPSTQLTIEPTFKYGAIKMTDSPVSEHLWTAGLNTSYLVNLH